jgi:hypothetical protein
MQDRGLIIIGMIDCYAGAFLSAILKPYPTDGHPDEIDINGAVEYGKAMVDHNRRIARGETGLLPPPPPPPPINQNELDDKLKAGRLDKEKIAFSFRNTVRFDKKKCLYPECRLCMDNCPVYGIDLKDNSEDLFQKTK